MTSARRLFCHIIQTLQTLHEAGGLDNTAITFRPCRVARELMATKQQHSKVDTPYGRIVQTLGLPHTDEDDLKWKYCNPLALLHYLAELSVSFL